MGFVIHQVRFRLWNYMYVQNSISGGILWPGDFKTAFIFFFWDLYFSNILTSKFGIPCSKVKQIFFLNIASKRFKRRALRHWTQISNHFSKILKIDWTGSKKSSKIRKFYKKYCFSHVNRTFFDISLNITTIFEEKIFLKLY